tara:strand:+ start:279 stop:626 length:348 start_codon:yes stop_codon:yes gene_type:complete
MGWWQRLGKKIASGVSTLGKKVASGVKAGVKWGYDHAEQIADIAGKVDKVAGVVGKAATAAIPWTAEIPIVGEIVAGTAGAAKVVGKGAQAVQRVAGAVSKGKRAIEEARGAVGL